MTKTISKSQNDLFFVALVVLVIVSAITVIFVNRQTPTQVSAEVEGAKTESSEELMNQLNSTVDDGGKADFIKLSNDASGL